MVVNHKAFTKKAQSPKEVASGKSLSALCMFHHQQSISESTECCLVERAQHLSWCPH